MSHAKKIALSLAAASMLVSPVAYAAGKAPAVTAKRASAPMVGGQKAVGNNPALLALIGVLSGTAVWAIVEATSKDSTPASP